MASITTSSFSSSTALYNNNNTSNTPIMSTPVTSNRDDTHIIQYNNRKGQNYDLSEIQESKEFDATTTNDGPYNTTTTNTNTSTNTNTTPSCSTVIVVKEEEKEVVLDGDDNGQSYDLSYSEIARIPQTYILILFFVCVITPGW